MASRTTEDRSEKTLERADAIRNNEGKIEPLRRYTEEGIAARREHVWRFLVRRVPQTVMAELLGVTSRTISDDVAWWREQCRKQTEETKNDPSAASADIGSTAARLEGIAAAALADYELSRSAQMKNLFLVTAIKAEVARGNLLINTGIWPKAGEEIRVQHNIKATFEARLGSSNPLTTLDEPVSRRRVLDAAERVLRLSMDRRQQKIDELRKPTIDVQVASKDA